MSYLKSITKSDRVTFEGCEVVKILPDVDPKTKEVTHFTFTVIDAESIPNLRYFRATEITTLIEREKIVIDRGYYSAGRQIDRDRNGETELISAKPAQRDRAHRYAFLARTIDKLHSQGMPLTRDGVDAHFKKIHADYKRFQARVKYGTLESNSSQTLLATPSSATLLEINRKLRNSGGNPACFVTRRLSSVVFSDQQADDFAAVMSILEGYAHESCPSKGEIAQRALDAVKEINVIRRQDGFPKPMREYKSVRTYERWIDNFLDPFTVELSRNGIEKARKKFGSRESGNPVIFPGERVEFDAWQFHVVTLDVTRKRWLAMTEEERKAVKRVRRWVVVAIDVATRCIVNGRVKVSQRAAQNVATLGLV